MESVKKEKKINKTNKKGVLKTLFFILLFIVLLPFMIVGSLIKFFIDKKKRKKWEKNGLRGKALILNTEIQNIDKMPTYEFENYLKTLFFYDDYSVNEVDNKKDNLFFVSRNNIDSLVCFVNNKKQVTSKMFLKAEKNKVKYDMEQIIFVTNKEFSSLVNKMVENKNVFLINREKLIEMQNIVKQKISLTTKKQDLVDRFDLNINDKFPYLI